jgi:antitoxin (DNA-binding transcriptional repressor) of toxin-antitoxin stability system
MTRVAVDVAQKKLPSLIDDVLLGRHVLITRDQKPVAELVPVRSARPRPKFGSAKGLVSLSSDFDAPMEDFAEYVA